MRERSEARAEAASRRTRERGTYQAQHTMPASTSPFQGATRRCRGAAFAPPYGPDLIWTAALGAALHPAAPARATLLGPKQSLPPPSPWLPPTCWFVLSVCLWFVCVGVSGQRPAPCWRFAPRLEALGGAGAPCWRMAAEYRNTTSLTSGRRGAEPHSSYDLDPPVNAGAERGTGGNGKLRTREGGTGQA